MVEFIAVGARYIIQLCILLSALSGLIIIVSALYGKLTNRQSSPDDSFALKIFTGIIRTSIASVIQMINTGAEFVYHPLYLFSKPVVDNLGGVTGYVWMGYAIALLACLASIFNIWLRESPMLGRIIRTILFVALIEGLNSSYDYVF